MRRVALALTTAALLSASVVMAPAATARPAGTIIGAGHPDAVPGSYLVAYKPTAKAGLDLAAERGVGVSHRYAAATRGFAATMSEAQARALAAHPDVAVVEQNRTVRLASPVTARPVHTTRGVRPAGPAIPVPPMGRGVKIYVIDTGVRTTHTAFGGRASWGVNLTGDGIATDCNGHGTHVAGTAAGTVPDRWTAWRANVIAVKVLTCSGIGTTAGVIAGVDWVTANRSGPSVANMSLGGVPSTLLDQAVRASIASGVTYVLAAGNSDAPACGSSPAGVTEGITVGATHDTKLRAWFSNHGSCLDVFAPGVGIVAPWHTSNSATSTLSGTSMAAPAVAARAAMYLSSNLTAAPAQIGAHLIANAELNQVVDPRPGSPNRFLGSSTVTPPAPPTATGVSCESYLQQVYCFGSATGFVTDTAWHVNGYAAGGNGYSVTAGCTVGTATTVRFLVANPGGASHKGTTVFCWGGPPH